jgi:hypothetical protein
MLDSNLLGSNMTIDKLLLELSKLKSFKYKENEFIRPMTLSQRKILEALGIELPVTL